MKDMNSNELPSVMDKGDDVVVSEDLAEMFAEMFQTKISTLTLNAKIGPNVNVSILTMKQIFYS